MDIQAVSSLKVLQMLPDSSTGNAKRLTQELSGMKLAILKETYKIQHNAQPLYEAGIITAPCWVA
jgi:hypothetical protein